MGGPLGQRYSAEADAGKVVADTGTVVSDVVFMDEAVSKLAKIDSLPALAEWPRNQRNEPDVRRISHHRLQHQHGQAGGCPEDGIEHRMH